MGKGARKRKQPASVAAGCIGFLPQLKKPAEAVGKQIYVLGQYWENCPAEDKSKEYNCVVTDFDAIHTWPDGNAKTSAMKVMMLGVKDGPQIDSGDHFWMRYPLPFLEYFYKAHPLAGEEPTATAEQAQTTQDVEAEGAEDEGEAAEKKVVVSAAYQFVDKVLSKVMGKKIQTIYKCNCVVVEQGQGGQKVKCNTQITSWGRSTSNIFKHYKHYAKTCSAHAEVLELLNEASCKQVLDLATGMYVPKFSFQEAFRHHCHMVWLIANRTPQNIRNKADFRELIRGYEPRAVFPAHETIRRIAEVIDALQREDQRNRIQALRTEFSGRQCLGIQLDMWTCGVTHTCYAVVNMTTCPQPKTPASPMRLISEVLEFEVFPSTEHSAVNILKWFTDVLEKKNISVRMISGITPDGAADGQKAFSLNDDLAKLVDTCYLHQLQRSVLYAIGLAGSGAGMVNPDFRDHMRKHRRVVQLAHQSREVGSNIRKIQLDNHIPTHKVISPVTTVATRWGNQYSQVTVRTPIHLYACTLSPMRSRARAHTGPAQQ